MAGVSHITPPGLIHGCCRQPGSCAPCTQVNEVIIEAFGGRCRPAWHLQAADFARSSGPGMTGSPLSLLSEEGATTVRKYFYVGAVMATALIAVLPATAAEAAPVHVLTIGKVGGRAVAPGAILKAGLAPRTSV